MPQAPLKTPPNAIYPPGPTTPGSMARKHPINPTAPAASFPQDLLIRLGILQLAEAIKSISAACRWAGISRTTFYKIKRAYENGGYLGLQPAPRKKPKMPNAFSESVVEQVLEETRKFPSYSYNRIAERLRAQGLKISGSGVRKIWQRKGLRRSADRRLFVQLGVHQS